MTAHLSLDDRVAGSVRFDRSVSVDTLVEIIRELKSLGEEKRWVDLHIRPGGDDGTHVMAFHYILRDGKRRTQKRAIRGLITLLKDKLGTVTKKKAVLPRGVCDWTISTVQVVA